MEIRFKTVAAYCLSLLFVFGIFTSFAVMSVHASGNTYIVYATVSIGMCGDGDIAGNEECEGADLAGKTCENTGHLGGELKCDASCSFDFTVCDDAKDLPTYEELYPQEQADSAEMKKDPVLEKRQLKIDDGLYLENSNEQVQLPEASRKTAPFYNVQSPNTSRYKARVIDYYGYG